MMGLGDNDWADALRCGLGATVETLAIQNDERLLTVFRIGPFRIAYPDFPAGAIEYSHVEFERFVAAASNANVDMIRFHSYKPIPIKKHVFSQTLDSHCIHDLQNWDESGIKKARRTRNRLERSPLQVKSASEEDAEQLFQMYSHTISRNKGAIRYTPEYFRMIAPLSVFVCMLDKEISGFVSSANLNNRVVYLHGAYDPKFKHLYPSDILFLHMIRNAKAKGYDMFDFLPSPKKQSSLAFYKKQWGAVYSSYIVSDLLIKPLRGRIFLQIRRLAEFPILRNISTSLIKSSLNIN